MDLDRLLERDEPGPDGPQWCDHPATAAFYAMPRPFRCECVAVRAHAIAVIRFPSRRDAGAIQTECVPMGSLAPVRSAHAALGKRAA